MLLLIAPVLPGCRGNAPSDAARRAEPAPRTQRTATPDQPEARAATLTADRADERAAMVRRQIAGRDVVDDRVLDAMLRVPRHWFVTNDYQYAAYDDRPLPIGFGQTISQPYIVAKMTELLRLQRGQRVLEIGTGSGYQAAVLAELTDEVYSIEIVEPLATRTIELLKNRGYGGVHVRIGDGYRGWPEAAPFDAIIVTCAPDEVPQPLIDQLAVGGRMCIPVGRGPYAQDLYLLTKNADGTMNREVVFPVSFVPMTGEAERD